MSRPWRSGALLVTVAVQAAAAQPRDYLVDVWDTDRGLNGDFGDGDVLGTNPPACLDCTAFVSAPAYTYGNTPRTLAFGLRNPNAINQDLSIQRDFRLRGSVTLRVGAEVMSIGAAWAAVWLLVSSLKPEA